jgi:citrate synthase
MMLQEGGVKIWRPRQVRSVNMAHLVFGVSLDLIKIYVGSGKRDYVPTSDRVPVDGLRKEPTPTQHSG